MTLFSVAIGDLLRTGRAAGPLDLEAPLSPPPSTRDQPRITVPVPLRAPRTFRLRTEGTLRLAVGHTPARDQELRIGREGRLVARADERLRVRLRRDMDLVVHAAQDLGFVESTLRVQRAWAALDRLLPPEAPRSVEVGLDAVTLVADDELSPAQHDDLLRDLAEVARSLTLPSRTAPSAPEVRPAAPQAPPPPPAPLPLRRSSLWARGRLQERAPRSVILGAGQLVARSRAAGPQRCAFCHDGFEDAPARCPGCDTAVHADCVEELRRCPTAGCDERRRAA